MILAVLFGCTAICGALDCLYIKYRFLKRCDSESLSGVAFVRKRKKKGIFLAACAGEAAGLAAAAAARGFILWKRPEIDLLFFAGRLMIFRLVLRCSVTDICDRIIPNELTFGFGFLWLGAVAAGLITGSIEYDPIDRLAGWIVITAVLLLIRFFARGGIGGGDIKLISLLAFCFGLRKIFPLLTVSFFLSAAFGLVMLLMRRAKLKDSFPLAPFILAGTIFESAAELIGDF